MQILTAVLVGVAVLAILGLWLYRRRKYGLCLLCIMTGSASIAFGLLAGVASHVMGGI